MKIGIFTYYNNYNFGSYLQSYALKGKIQSMGYEACIIDFKDVSKPWNKMFQRRTMLSRLICSIKHPSLFLDAYKARKVGISSTMCNSELKQKFDDFANSHLNFYHGEYVNDSFGAYVVGSDQVWKVTLPGLHYVLFLRFAPSYKRISYAASLGANSIPRYNKSELRKYLLNFSSISVREDESVNLLSELDSKIQAQFVLDPVLLVGEEYWTSKLPSVCYQNYILFYFLDSIDDKIEIIKQLKRKYPNDMLLMVNTVDCRIDIDGLVLINPSPLEFVSLIYSCDAMITDSFHGTAFSVLFKKDFYTIPRNYQLYSGQRGRLFSLLRLAGCEDRYIETPASIYCVQKIKDSQIERTLDRMRKSSNNFLKKAIEKSINCRQ